MRGGTGRGLWVARHQAIKWDLIWKMGWSGCVPTSTRGVGKQANDCWPICQRAVYSGRGGGPFASGWGSCAKIGGERPQVCSDITVKLVAEFTLVSSPFPQ